MKKKTIYLLALIITILGCSGCEVAEPSRFYNSNVDPIRTGNLALDTLQGLRTVSGNIFVTIDTVGMNFPVAEMMLYIADDDDVYGNVAEKYPFTFKIDSWRYDDGLNDITIWVINKDAKNGLYNLGDAPRPALILHGKIDIDNSWPEPVSLTAKRVPNSPYVKLTWPPTPSRNFTSYIIYRSYYGQLLDSPIDTLYNITDTVYVDAPEFISGRALFYGISVTSNGNPSGSPSNTAEIYIP